MNRTSSIARPLFALAAALIAAPLAARRPVAVTGEPQPSYQERVSLDDLDLTKGSHRNMLKSRVQRAADRLCIATDGPFDVNRISFLSAPSCPEMTYDGARSQIAAAINRAKAGQPQLATALVVTGPAKPR